MKITRLTVWQRDLPLSEPYWLSGGRLKFEQLDSTFLRIDKDAGVSGWGEGCPWGHTYLPAHGVGLRAGIIDIARIEGISSALPEGHRLTFDVNRAWTPAMAIEVLNSVAARDWVEQPCETLDQWAHVAKRVQNPIMLDECMTTFQDHLEAWRRGACEGVKVKPNRVGGLTRARQIRDFGVSVGWQMHIEDVGGSALADTAAIHLAASTPDENRLASWLCHYHLSDDPVPGQGARNAQGFATPPCAPGLGVAPDPDILGQPVAVYEV